jgi:hypothetical protein
VTSERWRIAVELLGGQACRWLATGLRQVAVGSRRDGIDPPASFGELLTAVEEGAFRSEHAELPIRKGMQGSVPVRFWSDPVGTTEAAALLGITPRGVRALCSRGVFETAGVRSGQWWVERSEVAARVRAGQGGNLRP